MELKGFQIDERVSTVERVTTQPSSSKIKAWKKSGSNSDLDHTNMRFLPSLADVRDKQNLATSGSGSPGNYRFPNTKQSNQSVAQVHKNKLPNLKVKTMPSSNKHTGRRNTRKDLQIERFNQATSPKSSKKS